MRISHILDRSDRKSWFIDRESVPVAGWKKIEIDTQKWDSTGDPESVARGQPTSLPLRRTTVVL